jgi:hypothetical protein
VWSQLQAYSAATTCTWTPSTSGQYYLEVWALDVGSGNAYDQYAEIAYQVCPPLSGVTLSASPASPQPAKTTITLTATPTYGAAPQYEFWVLPPNGEWSQLQAYSAANTCTWVPSVNGSYGLEVWALDQGSTNTYDQWDEITFTVGLAPSDTLAPGQSVDGSLPVGGGSNWLRFTLGARSAVTVTAEGPAGQFEVLLTDEQGATLGDDAHPGAKSSLSRTLPAGTYDVGVGSDFGASAVDYRLTLVVSAGAPAAAR